MHPKYYSFYVWLLVLLPRSRVAEILSGAERDFRASEEDCSIERCKKGADGFLVKDINVSGLTGSEYC